MTAAETVDLADGGALAAEMAETAEMAELEEGMAEVSKAAMVRRAAKGTRPSSRIQYARSRSSRHWQSRARAPHR